VRGCLLGRVDVEGLRLHTNSTAHKGDVLQPFCSTPIHDAHALMGLPGTGYSVGERVTTTLLVAVVVYSVDTSTNMCDHTHFRDSTQRLVRP
jgi:hypothetical protein